MEKTSFLALSFLKAKGLTGPPNLYNRGENPIEQGTIAFASGKNTNSASRCRTKDTVTVAAEKKYKIFAGIDYVRVFEYQTDGTYIGNSAQKSLPYTFTTGSNTGGIRFIFYNAAGSNVTPDEILGVRLIETT